MQKPFFCSTFSRENAPLRHVIYNNNIIKEDGRSTLSKKEESRTNKKHFTFYVRTCLKMYQLYLLSPFFILFLIFSIKNKITKRANLFARWKDNGFPIYNPNKHAPSDGFFDGDISPIFYLHQAGGSWMWKSSDHKLSPSQISNLLLPTLPQNCVVFPKENLGEM